MIANLSKDDLEILAELLRTRTEQLRVEVRRTDDPQYHDDLRNLERRMVSLLRRLETPEPAKQDHADL